MSAAPIVFLYETPYPVAFRKNVKGFVQIPLGNNLFAAPISKSSGDSGRPARHSAPLPGCGRRLPGPKCRGRPIFAGRLAQIVPTFCPSA